MFTPHHVSHDDIYLFIFLQSGGASRWRVCYQRGLPHLVLFLQVDSINIRGTCPLYKNEEKKGLVHVSEIFCRAQKKNSWMPWKKFYAMFLPSTFFWKLSKSKQRRPFEGRLCIDLENLQQFSSDMGHMTHDVWQVICDMLLRVNILSKLQLPSSYGVGRTVSWRYFNKSWPTEWMNGKAFLTQNMFYL